MTALLLRVVPASLVNDVLRWLRSTALPLASVVLYSAICVGSPSMSRHPSAAMVTPSASRVLRNEAFGVSPHGRPKWVCAVAAAAVMTQLLNT